MTAKTPSLRELLAQPVPLPVGGTSIDVAPMGWYQGCSAVEHLLPAMQQLPLLQQEGQSREDRLAAWAVVLLNYRDGVAAFCAEASGLPLDEVKGLPPTALCELVLGLVEINLDFFVQNLPGLAARVQGRMATLTGRLAPVLDQLGAGLTSADSTTSSSA